MEKLRLSSLEFGLPEELIALAGEVRRVARVPYMKEILDWDDVVARMLAVYQEGL